MAETTPRSAKSAEKALAARYEKVGIRTEPLDRLVDFLSGTPDPLEQGDREQLISRDEWASYDTRRRNQAVGFLRRSFLRDRHQLHPPLHYSRKAKNDLFDRGHVRAAKSEKMVFRYKDYPIVALAPRGTLPVIPLIALVPRLKTTPTEDLAVVLASKLFHFYWQHYHGKSIGKGTPSVEERLAGFQVPMLTKRTGGPFREARDRILELAEANSERLLAMDRVQQVAEQAGVPLVPLLRTEGIIREINVPKPLAEVSDVKRRGPVVIFRRGSTIVTTTEEAATYLELWLRQRFDQLGGMTRDRLEEFILMPTTTASVVVVLQHRARIEFEVGRVQDEIEELQREAEDHLYDLYEMTEEEREYLRSVFV